MGGSEISICPGNWAPSEPALPHARKSKKPVLEWPFRGGTDSSNLLSSSGLGPLHPPPSDFCLYHMGLHELGIDHADVLPPMKPA